MGQLQRNGKRAAADRTNLDEYRIRRDANAYAIQLRHTYGTGDDVTEKWVTLGWYPRLDQLAAGLVLHVVDVGADEGGELLAQVARLEATIKAVGDRVQAMAADMAPARNAA